uniref:hypothetical protein n=1 Tax=uncultured Draconibacterium sp. TaxID=1573823 RepID=UPI00321734D2
MNSFSDTVFKHKNFDNAVKKPVSSNSFLRFIVEVFDIDLQHKTLKGVKNEIENMNNQIDMGKDNLKVD